jgi:hypothetical protein
MSRHLVMFKITTQITPIINLSKRTFIATLRFKISLKLANALLYYKIVWPMNFALEVYEL